MRILHTESSCGWGGQEIRILTEAAGMIAKGHEVSLVCPAEARIFTEAERFGVSAEALPIAQKSGRALLALRHYLRAMSQKPFDVINCHSSTDSWLSALALLGAQPRAALVRTRHVSAPVPNNLPSRWLYQRASDMVVTTGEALRQQLISANGLDPKRVVSIPTGIDLSRYTAARPAQRQAARLRLGLGDDRFVCGIVATLRSWKGHRFLVEAMARLNRWAGPAKVQLLIVGDGPQREALEQQISAAGIASSVQLLGNQNDVLQYLHAFDVFALPSYANEGVPQALLQAMACAVPVVTTDAGAIGEVARDGETAVVVAKEDSTALAQGIEQVIIDPAGAKTRAARALSEIEARFSLPHMVSHMERVFANARRHTKT